MNIYDRILELLETGDDECKILGAILWRSHTNLKELWTNDGAHYVWESDNALTRRGHFGDYQYVYMNGIIPKVISYSYTGVWIEDPSRSVQLVYNPYLDGSITNYSATTGWGYGGRYNTGNSVVAQFSGAIISSVL